MATENNKIRTEELIEATVRVSNKCDADRAYDIEANARIRKGRLAEVSSGTACLKGSSSEDYGTAASFTRWEGSRLNVEFPTDEGASKGAVLTAIESFIGDLKEHSAGFGL